jgi:hypothetical protein
MDNHELEIELLNRYPIATEILRDWFIKRMKKSLDEDQVSEEFKEMLIRKGVPDTTLAIMLNQNPRGFFDVLDENKIIIEILHVSEFRFYYTINDVSFNDVLCENRVTCEYAAVTKALRMLH